MAETTDPFTATPDPKPDTAPAADPTPAPSVLTEYLVLKKVGDGWDVVQSKTARNANAAIKDVVEKLAEVDQDGTFVAPPVRSWNPIVVKPKTVRTLEMEAAS